jgi:hypothetical protein
MKIAHLASATFLALSAVSARAADLTTVDRKIAKEPAYQTKAPKYCLLVFGPEAKTRVWLVQDGDSLYVDKNGNGDLTEPGEKVAAKKGDATDPAEGVFYFEAGEIADGKRVHKNLSLVVAKIDHLSEWNDEVKPLLAKDPKARGYQIRIDVEMPGQTGTGIGGRIEQLVALADVHGLLRFGDQPGNAPIIPLGGPLQITVCAYGKIKMTIGREAECYLAVGTPGLGAGTTAYVAYQKLIPEGAHPRADFTYPPGKEGDKPLTQSLELKRRC